jgi:hypothetical protein
VVMLVDGAVREPPEGSQKSSFSEIY